MTSIFMRNPRLERNAPITDEVQATIESQEEEILSLRKQLSSLKSLYKESKKDSKEDSSTSTLKNDLLKKELSCDLLYQRQRIEKLLGVVAERERQLRDLQQEMQSKDAANQEALKSEKRENQSALAEVESLHSQLNALKLKFLESQRTQKSLNVEVENLTTENYKVKLGIQEAHADLKDRDTLKLECDKLSSAYAALLLQDDEKSARITSLENSLTATQESLQAKELQISSLNSTLENSEKKVSSLQHEKSLQQDILFKIESAKEDAEARLKMAHFHLAKKVKEATVQTDLNENLEANVRELTADLNDSQLKIQELQKLLEDQFLAEKRLQEQFQESLKESSALANAWEEKFFNISDKWQEFELRFNDMKKLEDKIQKIHSSWINMGFLFDSIEQASTITTNLLPLELTENISQTLNEIEIKKNPPLVEKHFDAKQTYQNFEISQGPKLFMSNIIQNSPRNPHLK